MNYLLDTDTISYFLRDEGLVGEKIRTHKPSEIAVSAITIAELRFGADKRKSNRIHLLIDTVGRTFRVLPFDEQAAQRFGVVAANLERSGQEIGSLDCMIAAHALSQGLTLVTRNVVHFKRIRGLKMQNWYE